MRKFTLLINKDGGTNSLPLGMAVSILGTTLTISGVVGLTYTNYSISKNNNFTVTSEVIGESVTITLDKPLENNLLIEVVPFSILADYPRADGDEFHGELIPIGEEIVTLLADYALVVNKVDYLNSLRTYEVSKIVVTLADTVTVLDGDEVSQGRISRAILALADDIATTTWIGANEDVYSLNRPELKEALALAGEAQTAIWVNYATLKSAL